VTYITLAHGNGGRLMRQLIDEVFAKHLYRERNTSQLDAAPLPLPPGEVLITTDAFTVKPLEFPGGDIGSLAVHGTVNDLAVCGATPCYLTLNAIIEEGFELARLTRLVRSLADAADACGVSVIAGDTRNRIGGRAPPPGTGARNGRVTPGGCSPGVPTDPDVRNSRIRLLKPNFRYVT
jgi:hydrogenase expression/formation protein HypE